MNLFTRIRKPLSFGLSVLLGLSMLAGLFVLPAAAEDSAPETSALPDVDAPSFLTDEEHDTGFETVSFSKNGMEGSPFTSGLNNPWGYYFKLDESKKLTRISITDHATYSTNVNKGTYTLYQWQGDYKKTVASKPLVKIDLVNAQDHNDLVMDVPAELNATGELYFEVVATEGAGYTPWLARGGAVTEIPGIATGIQCYQKGGQSHGFACDITVADMVNQSPVKFINWTYDFSVDMTDPNGELPVNHLNQINVGKAHDGYTTFTATGSDPYFRIPDDKSPTPKANELAYVAILYRTKAAVAGGEFFTNHGGQTWGGAGTHAETAYTADGLWHVALTDASTSWGTDTDNTLFAFRFDPLISGCETGDTIDVAWLKFFGDGDMAAAYVDEQNLRLNNARQTERDAGTDAYDFTTGRLPAGVTLPDGQTVFVKPDFVRLMNEGSGELRADFANIRPGFRFVKVIYRGGGISSLGISSASGAILADEVVTDGFWTETVLTLPVDASLADTSIICTADTADAWVDLAAVAFCDKAAYAETYLYDGTLNTHMYAVGQTPIPVLTCTVAECGSPYCGPGEYYGQKFTSDQPVWGVIVYNNSTWQDGSNAGTFKLWKWQNDYKTTIAADPLYEKELKNLPNNTDLEVQWNEALEPGTYYYEVKLTGNSGNAYTGFGSKDGKAVGGAEAYRNGQPNGVALYAAYLTMGRGLEDLGEEYGTGPTCVLDFTRHIDNATAAFSLGGVTACTVTDLCDKGYLTFTSTGIDPFLTLGSFPETQGSLCDWIVIKYRTESKATHGEFFVCRTDGVTWGQDYARSNVLFDWQNDGQWHVAVIDATNVWGNAGKVAINNLRFDPLEKPDGADESIDVASITFFANGRAANAYAESLYAVKDGEKYVPAPRVPMTADQVHPVLVIDGEALEANGGNQMSASAYSFKDGFISLTAKGEDPGYYLISEKTAAAPYALIRYRTSAAGVRGEIYAGSTGKEATGKGDRLTFDYIPDNQWHDAVVDLSTLSAYNAKTGELTYLRYDFLDAGSSPVRSGQRVDVECVAFFNTEDEAFAFEHTLPTAAKTFTLSFYADGHFIVAVQAKQGEPVNEPVVPKKPGMIGTWEAYVLDGDKNVNAVYVPANPEEAVTLPAETPTEADTQPSATEPASVDATEAGTEPGEKGCGSFVSLSSLIVLSLCGIALIRRRDTD